MSNEMPPAIDDVALANERNYAEAKGNNEGKGRRLCILLLQKMLPKNRFLRHRRSSDCEDDGDRVTPPAKFIEDM